MMKVRFSLAIAAIFLFFSTSSIAADNELTAGDLEGVGGVDGYWAPAPGIWGAESASISTGEFGISPRSGSQMLRINDAGGGTVAQAHQMVSGPYAAGSIVTFEVYMNTSISGIQLYLALEERAAVNVGPSLRVNSPWVGLNANTSDWELVTFTHTLAADTNVIAAEIAISHGSIPGGFGSFAAMVDDAVLTVVPPATAGTVIDIDGQVHGDPNRGCCDNDGVEEELQVYAFEAGTYILIPISDNFTAWTQWENFLGWENVYQLTTDELGTVTVGDFNTQYGSPEEALSRASTYTMTLTADANVRFSVTDPFSLADNAGGISLLVDVDVDLDGVPDISEDNCVDVFNPDQSDADGDGAGDACDSDDDDDGILDDSDNCPLDANVDQADVDGDATGDACDTNNDDGPLGDLDGDGVINNVDACPGFDDSIDTDGDGIADGCDDNNNDGPLGDLDGDGVINDVDACPGFDDNVDSDGDGIADGCDDNNNDGPLGDLDGDGIENQSDSCADSSGPVDASGCSGAQLVLLACPTDGAYRNHGAYVSCVAKASEALVESGLLTEAEKDAIVSAAGGSDIGKKSGGNKGGSGKGKAKGKK